MPCRDYDSDYDRSVAVSMEMTKLREQNDRLARIACEAMTELTKVKNLKGSGMTAETIEWWIKHQEADHKEQERKAKEKEHNRQVAIKAQKRREIIALLIRLKNDVRF